jgi:ribonuclease Y
MMDKLIYVLLFAAGFAAGIALYLRLKLSARAAKEEARIILGSARQEAEKAKKEAELALKEESYKKRQEMEKEIQEGRTEMRSWEKRLTKREDGLDHKAEILSKKERFVEKVEQDLRSKTARLQERDAELDKLLQEQKEALHRVSQMSREEAERVLLERLSKEMERESAVLISRALDKAKEEADREAKNIVVNAIQRVAADYTQEVVVSTIDLPNDDVKGRVIGREGRNIRAFEKATGVDLIVDDTPGVVVVSSFDGVRREMARRALEKLIADGRIHPARIEEVVEATKKEMNELMMETGKQAALDLDIHGLHPREIMLLGRLRFRTSYGQNVLQHSVEVAHLCAAIAAELSLDVKLAKRCGLLHDIGKAIDHEVEGKHQAIGADLARRYKEAPEVINAIAAHHEDVPVESLYAAITAAADAISAARPGARRETLEKYIKRLETLESIATSFEGVKAAYAIQAGREVRVIVEPEKVDDSQAAKMCRDIAAKVQQELAYPGEIKITLLRETRVVEYAR